MELTGGITLGSNRLTGSLRLGSNRLTGSLLTSLVYTGPAPNEITDENNEAITDESGAAMTDS